MTSLELDLSWQRWAACSAPDIDPAIFFPERGDTSHIAEARRICATCPVIGACREHGINYEKHGIWGGTTERQRRRIRVHRNSLKRVA